MKQRRKDRAEAIAREVFGGTLSQQGRGFYVALEFLAISWGRLALADSGGLLDGEPAVLPAAEGVVTYARRSHDFARRLLASPATLTDEERNHLGSSSAEQTLRALLDGLTVPVFGRRKRGSWKTEHLYPYVGDLIHYDAVERGPKKKPTLERQAYRGGGALVHRMLRTDPDLERVQRVRVGLVSLVSPSDSSLGRLARKLTQLDAAHSAVPFEDDRETFPETLEESPYVEALRVGVDNIVGREDLPQAKRVEALMYLLPFCIALHQAARAYSVLGVEDEFKLVVDLQGANNPIREYSRRQVKVAISNIHRAMEDAALRKDPELLEGSQRWRDQRRAFFTTTLAGVGALNALTGVRHASLGPELCEALVLAFVPQEMTFARFCRSVLYDGLRLVADQKSAEDAGLLETLDQSTFEENADALAELLRDLGLLHEYSDMTKMVRGGS